MASPVNLRAIVGLVDRASAPLRGIGRGFSGVAMRARLAQISLARMAKTAGMAQMVQRLGAAGKAAGALWQSLKQAALWMASLAGVAAGGGLAAIMSGGASRGDAIAKEAARIGIGVEAYQELAYAAKQADIEQTLFDKSMQKAGKSIADAASGKNKDLSALYSRMGIALRDQNGQLRNSADILPELADAFRRNENPVLRTRMAMALFGEEGARMVDMLVDGSEALARQREEARKYGVLTEEQVAALSRLDNGYKFVGASLRGVTDLIAAQLAPVLAPILEDMANWIAANREWIATNIGDAVKSMVLWLKSFDGDAVKQWLKDTAASVRSVVSFFGGWRNVIIAVIVLLNAGLILNVMKLIGALGLLGLSTVKVAAALILMAGTQVIGAIGSLVTALRAGYGAMAALNLVMAANPIGLVIIAVAALIAAGVLLWRNWDAVKEKLSGVWDWIRSAAASLYEAMKPVLEALKFVMKWSPAGIAIRAGKSVLGIGGDGEDGAGALGQKIARGRGDLRSEQRSRSADGQRGEGEVTAVVDFRNLPRGATVKTESKGRVRPRQRVGYAMERVE